MRWRMGFWKRQRERKMEGGVFFFFFFVKFYDVGRAFSPAEEAMEWVEQPTAAVVGDFRAATREINFGISSLGSLLGFWDSSPFKR